MPPNSRARIDLLRGAYEGLTCVVVTCGPSLEDHSRERLLSILRGTLTVAVKQAVDVVGPVTDIHCFNIYNVKRYRGVRQETIRILTTDPRSRAVQYNRADVELPLWSGDRLLEDSISAAGDFAANQLDRGIERRRGPGILYETVLPVAHFVGARRIVTIGWDVAARDGTNRHFDDGAHQTRYYERLSRSSHRDRGRVREITALDAGLRRLRTSMRHLRGETYNLARMQPGEADLAVRGSEFAARWLEAEGIEFAVISPKSLAAPQIDRWSLDELADHVAS